MTPAAPELRDNLNHELAGEGIALAAPVSAEQAEVLTAESLRFVLDLARRFEPTRQALLEERRARQREIDAGKLPDFLPSTRAIRESDWRAAPIPRDLLDRRVEITGPVERKMIINALNSGAKAFMADFEDSNTPNWQNIIEGQINLRDAVQKTISYEAPETGKKYTLNEEVATLLVRP